MVMEEITPVDLLRYIHPWPKSLICVGMIPQKGYNGKPSWIWCKRVDIVKHLRQLKIANTRAQRNIYYSVASYSAKKRTKDNVKAIQVLWLDFDAETEAMKVFREGQSWQDIPVPNIYTETSPGHAQFFWLLEQPMPSADIEGIVRGMAEATGADMAATDVSRVMRLPGFQNVNRGRYDVKAYMLHGQRLFVEEFQRLKCRYYQSKDKDKKTSLPKAKSSAKRALQLISDDAISSMYRFIGLGARKKALRRWNSAIKKGKSPSEGDWAVTGFLSGIGVPKEEIVQFLKELRPEKHEKYHEYTVEKFLQQKNNPRVGGTEANKTEIERL